MLHENVELNRFGYYQAKNIPTKAMLERYYSDKYYQESSANYSKTYSNEDISYFNNRFKLKKFIIEQYFDQDEKLSFIDIGCGEGFALSYFNDNGYPVVGIDYSSDGITRHNPHVIENVLFGDIESEIVKLNNQGKHFDIVNLDNVLEHVVDPEAYLDTMKSLLTTKGIMIIQVPNDFSLLQNYLYDSAMISEPDWVVLPDHLSYFNKDGLVNLLKSVDLNVLDVYGIDIIEFNLFNERSNYYKDKSFGKAAHDSRMRFENFINTQPLDKVLDLYKAMGELGIGRELVGVFSLK